MKGAKATLIAAQQVSRCEADVVFPVFTLPPSHLQVYGVQAVAQLLHDLDLHMAARLQDLYSKSKVCGGAAASQGANPTTPLCGA